MDITKYGCWDVVIIFRRLLLRCGMDLAGFVCLVPTSVSFVCLEKDLLHVSITERKLGPVFCFFLVVDPGMAWHGMT